MKTTIVTLCVMLVGVLVCFAEGTPNQQAAALSKKLDSIVIPKTSIRDANVNDVVEFLVAEGKQHDPDKTGVNIILIDKENKSTITLSLEKVSMHKVLKLVSEMAGLSLDLEDGIVVLRKPKATSGNHSGNDGGGLRLDNNSKYVLTNTLVGSNSAPVSGGAMHASGSVAALKSQPSPAFAAPKAAMKVIVNITGAKGCGTGFLGRKDDETYLFTTMHVLMGNANILFRGSDGTRYTATIMEGASDRDVVRIKLANTLSNALVIGAAETVNVPITICGYAGGQGVMRSVYGMVLGTGPTKVETDAQFIQGHNGSPMFATDGTVVGVAAYAIRANADWMSTNTPLMVIRRFGYRLDNVEQWITIEHKWFGSETQILKKREDILEQVTRVLDYWARDPYWTRLPEFQDTPLLLDWIRDRNARIDVNRRRVNNLSNFIKKRNYEKYTYLDAEARMKQDQDTKITEWAQEFQHDIRQDGDLLKFEVERALGGKLPVWHLPFFSDYSAELSEWAKTLIEKLDTIVAFHASYNPVYVIFPYPFTGVGRGGTTPPPTSTHRNAN